MNALNYAPLSVRHNLSFCSRSLTGLLLAGLLLCSAAKADIIYDNSVNDVLVRFDPGSAEIGDQILLTGTARYLTNFSFEYWGTSMIPGQFAGNVEVCVRFYLNNGQPFNSYKRPGTKFFDSGWFPVQPTERSVLKYASPADLPYDGLLIPDSEITWSVQFRNLGVGDAAGVDLYGPIAAGLGYPDYWLRTPSGWQLETNSVSSTPINFAARLDASTTPIVSQPTIDALKIAGNKLVLSWPAWAADFDLYLTSSVGQGAPWTLVNSSEIYLNATAGKFFYTNSMFTVPGAKGFWRLKYAP